MSLIDKRKDDVMAKLVQMKAYKAGRVTEVYTYDKPHLKGYRNKIDKRYRYKKDIPIDERYEHRMKSLHRAKAKFRRLAYANESKLKRFVTLTFDKEVDITTAIKRFNYFKDRLRKKYSDIKLEYLVVYNFQECGKPHFHMLWNLPFISHEVLLRIWKYGSVWINDVTDINQSSLDETTTINIGEEENNGYLCVAHYMANHINENLIREELLGNNFYFSSRGLTKPVEIIDSENIRLLSNNEPNFEAEFDNEYHGRVKFERFIKAS